MFACFPEIQKREVIFMEDDSSIQSTVKKILEDELNCNVILVENKAKAIALASQKDSLFFILDVHMGRDREQEGLDTLEEIKAVNSNAPVFVLSSHQKYEEMANRLNADGFINKETNLKQVIHSKIEPEILKHELQVLKKCEQEIRSKLEKLLHDPIDDPNIQVDDPNIQAYENLISSKEALNEYKNKYVAFLNGNIIDSDLEKTKLLERLQQNYTNESCFFKQVKISNQNNIVNDIIDLPYYEIVEDTENIS